MKLGLLILTAFLQLLGSPAADAATPPAGLVSYWNFDDNTADSAWRYVADCGSAEDNLRAIGSAARYGPGKVGRAVILGGTHLAGRISPDVKLSPSYTIEAWIKPAELSPSWQRLVLHWGAQKAYHFALRDRQVSLYHKQTDGEEPRAEGGTVAEGKWQHIAAVADAQAGQLTVYLDGRPVDRVQYDGTMAETSGEGLGIGNGATGPTGGLGFVGYLDELAVWNVAVSDDRIKSHYENPDHFKNLKLRTFRPTLTDDGPAAYWKFDESDPSSIKDASGNGHDGRCLGDPQFQLPGIELSVENGAVTLDGVDDSIDFGPIEPLDRLTAITVEAWIRWTGKPGGFTREADFIRKENVFALGGSWYANRGASTYRKARFWIQDDKGTWLNSDNGTTDLDDGRWHHVAGVYDGQFLRIYVDGIEESSRKVGPVTLNTNAEPVMVGSSGGKSEFFTGQIDEAALYTRALSAVEIYEHYVLGSEN
ncbi:MAG: LamG domain-containing protein [Thermoguttaceae bacterium]